MNKFLHSAALQCCACVALGNMSQFDELKDALKHAGGRQAFLDAIKNHPDESMPYRKQIQQWAAAGLENLS